MSMPGSATGGLLNYSHVVQAAGVAVMGQSYLVDFRGNIIFLLDPDILSQYITGIVSQVPFLIQDVVSDGVGNIIGPITIRLDPDRIPPQSTLTSVVKGQPFPGVQDFNINIHVTIPNLLPGITLRNKIRYDSGSSILRNSNVTSFPSQNDMYTLVEPIELEDVNNPGPVLATINSFTATMNTFTS
jgi:hypothetical protein